MSHTPLPPCPQKSAPLWCIFFALLTLYDPQPAELKFRENTACKTIPFGNIFQVKKLLLLLLLLLLLTW